MTENRQLTKRWILAGIIFGLSTGLAFSSTQIPMGRLMGYIMFMSFGPLFCMTIYSMYQFFKESIDGVMLRLGTMLMIIAGALNTAMAAMQGSLRLYMFDLEHGDAVPETTHTAWKMALHAGNSIQLGMDVAWDYFVLPGMILFGVALLKHSLFGRIMGWFSILIGVSGMILNSWTFPEPPGSSGMFDVGPLAGIWFTVLTVYLIVVYRRYKVG